MGVFNSLFGNKDKEPKKEQKVVPWVPLTSVDQLNEIEKGRRLKLKLFINIQLPVALAEWS